MGTYTWPELLCKNGFSNNNKKQEPEAESHWAGSQEQVEADRALGKEHGWPVVEGDSASFVPAMRPLLWYRPAEVVKLEAVRWMDRGSHSHGAPWNPLQQSQKVETTQPGKGLAKSVCSNSFSATEHKHANRSSSSNGLTYRFSSSDNGADRTCNGIFIEHLQTSIALIWKQ